MARQSSLPIATTDGSWGTSWLYQDTTTGGLHLVSRDQADLETAVQRSRGPLVVAGWGNTLLVGGVADAPVALVEVRLDKRFNQVKPTSSDAWLVAFDKINFRRRHNLEIRFLGQTGQLIERKGLPLPVPKHEARLLRVWLGLKTRLGRFDGRGSATY